MPADPELSRQIELALGGLDRLPTPPSLARRVLACALHADHDVDTLLRLLRIDPALTARIHTLARDLDGADGGGVDPADAADPIRIEQAALQIGHHAVRDAALGLQRAHDGQPQSEDPERDADAARSDTTADVTAESIWRFQLAVAHAAEALAVALPALQIDPSDAFTAGLTHDLGRLAFRALLPRVFDLAAGRALTHQTAVAAQERRLFGLTHSAAGKRLCERWRLPHRITDTNWLHATPASARPAVRHAALVEIVSLAAATSRLAGCGNAGDAEPVLGAEALRAATPLPLPENLLADIAAALPDRVAATIDEAFTAADAATGTRPEARDDADLFQHANAALSERNLRLRQQAGEARRSGDVLRAIHDFHDRAGPGRSVDDTLDRVVRSAQSLWGAGFFAVLRPAEPGTDGQTDPQPDREGPLSMAPWVLADYRPSGERLGTRHIRLPAPSDLERELDAAPGHDVAALRRIPELGDLIVHAPDIREVRALPLDAGAGLRAGAILLHDARHDFVPSVLASLASTWAAAVTAALYHDGARRLGETLHETNAALHAAQRQIADNESMLRLGEMAAGAAHEMNNPLTVISGRAQLLTGQLDPESPGHAAAISIHRQTERLTNLITGLRMFADPPAAYRQPTDVPRLLRAELDRCAVEARRKYPQLEFDLQISQSIRDIDLPVDPDHLATAARELLDNAVQAHPTLAISVRAWVETDAGRRTLFVRVSDDGEGMDEYTLRHATDPFFSRKPAGRRVGVGLARVQQLAQAHGGSIRLRSTPGRRTTATLTLPLDPAA